MSAIAEIEVIFVVVVLFPFFSFFINFLVLFMLLNFFEQASFCRAYFLANSWITLIKETTEASSGNSKPERAL